MDDYIRDLTHVIRNCSMENTYKMAWIRSIVEACVLKPTHSKFHFDELAPLIFGYYWNQTFFFNLRQGPNHRKLPEIHQIVRAKIEEYRSHYGHKPEPYLKVEDKVCLEVGKISAVLKKDVCWRFQKVAGQEYKIYNLDKENLSIKMRRPDLLRDYADLLFEVINYRWTQKLEAINGSPRISQKVRGTIGGKIRRGSLTKFRSYLDHENPKRISFITGKDIPQKELSIDHMIPWSYMYSDDLWNLVYVEKRLNSQKNNKLPDEDMISRLELRNKRLMKILDREGIDDKHSTELRISIDKGLLKQYWVGSKG